jgi:hypothetical protein
LLILFAIGVYPIPVEFITVALCEIYQPRMLRDSASPGVLNALDQKKIESERARLARGGSPLPQSPCLVRPLLYIVLFCTIPSCCHLLLKLGQG